MRKRAWDRMSSEKMRERGWDREREKRDRGGSEIVKERDGVRVIERERTSSEQ